MIAFPRWWCAAAFVMLASVAAHAAEKPCTSPGCAGTLDAYFADEVWAKVGSQLCLNCHKVGGDAEESRFVLQDPSKSPADDRGAVLRKNREAFERIARLKEGDGSLVLLKVTGGLDHGGADVLKAVAMGASSVWVGRATLYGLAAGGEAGIGRALAIFREEISRAMALVGVSSPAELDRSHVMVGS